MKTIKLLSILFILFGSGCASAPKPVEPSTNSIMTITNDYENLKSCKKVDYVFYKCADDACIIQTALDTKKELNTLLVECEEDTKSTAETRAKTSLPYCSDNAFECVGIVTLNTVITTFDGAIITPLNIVWGCIIIWGSAEHPTTVTSHTTVKEKHDTIYVNTHYTIYEGKPATPIPTTEDGGLPFIPYVKWVRSSNVKPEKNNLSCNYYNEPTSTDFKNAVGYLCN